MSFRKPGDLLIAGLLLSLLVKHSGAALRRFKTFLCVPRPIRFDDGRDLLTDLIGLIAAFGVVWMAQRFRRRAAK